jgi:putative acetyltransferase
MTLPAKAEISIRPVRKEDAEKIWQISRQVGVIENIMTLPSERLAQRFSQLENLTSNEHYLVAETDQEEVIGLAGLTVGEGRVRHSGYLFLFVAAQYQGQGAGSKLLKALLDLADHWLLLRRVELTVLTENERAKKLYERFGFEVEGLRKLSVISQGQIKDEWLMARYR